MSTVDTTTGQNLSKEGRGGRGHRNRPHPREAPVAKAKAELQEFTCDLSLRHNLTRREELAILADLLAKKTEADVQWVRAGEEGAKRVRDGSTKEKETAGDNHNQLERSL